MIRYCRRCVMPETKPDILFDDEGVCSACRHFERRQEVDWDARRHELVEILDRYRSADGANYDCIIPVSGGKDSTYQTIRMLELGANPLCVTATTDKLSDIGRRNIENLKRLGVDYIEVTTNPVVRRRHQPARAHARSATSRGPSTSRSSRSPSASPCSCGIPLIVWGENSQNEYGGPAAAAEDNVLTGAGSRSSVACSAFASPTSWGTRASNRAT